MSSWLALLKQAFFQCWSFKGRTVLPVFWSFMLLRMLLTWSLLLPAIILATVALSAPVSLPPEALTGSTVEQVQEVLNVLVLDALASSTSLHVALGLLASLAVFWALAIVPTFLLTVRRVRDARGPVWLVAFTQALAIVALLAVVWLGLLVSSGSSWGLPLLGVLLLCVLVLMLKTVVAVYTVLPSRPAT